MNNILGRLAALEARRRPGAIRPYVVEWQAGETPDQAIARASPGGFFFTAPAPCATMEEWAAEAAAVLAS